MKAFEYATKILIPIFILAIIIHGMSKKIKVYDLFLEGASEGFKAGIRLFPAILTIIIAMNIFRESGAFKLVIELIKPVTNILKIPEEVLPLGFISSLSGGASLGILTDTIETYGPDSSIGKTASTILGSSETTLYVLAIYLSNLKINDTRGAIWIGLFCDFIAFIVAVWICK